MRRMLSVLGIRVRALFRRARMERDLDDEFSYHLDKAIEQNIQRGMTPVEARRAALVGLGGLDRHKEECRDARGVRINHELWRDLRFAGRLLAKRPGFTLAVVITLALGISTNTAVFSVVDAMLLKPLPFKDPGSLKWLTLKSPAGSVYGVMTPDVSAWRSKNHTFDDIEFWSSESFNLTGSGEPERVSCDELSGGLLEMLGVRPLIGRNLLPSDDRAEEGPVAMVGEMLWATRFGRSPGVIGQSIILSGKNYTVIGVAPRSMNVLGRADVFVAMGPIEDALRREHPFAFRMVSTVGRIKGSASIQTAAADLDRIVAPLTGQAHQNDRPRAVVIDLRTQLVGDTRTALLVLMGAVAFVLLIACANVANLLLARAATRESEIAIRAALGAGRLRLIRQLVVESVLLAVMGGGVGLLLAAWGIRALRLGLPAKLAERAAVQQSISLDSRVLLFTISITLLTGLVFGLGPALAGTRLALTQSLGRGGNRSTASRGSKRFREFLVIAEVALAVILLAGAGLMVRSFILLTTTRPGFRDPASLLTVEIELPPSRYAKSAEVRQFYRELLAKVQTLNGAKSATLVNSLPLEGFAFQSVLTIEGHPIPRGEIGPLIPVGLIGSDYFGTFRIPLIKGRTFRDQDPMQVFPNTRAPSTTSPPVIVNDAFARTYWPNQDPLGKRISDGIGPGTVVGVVGDVKQGGLAAEFSPQIFVPGVESSMYLAVRAEGDPKSLIPAIRAQVEVLDKQLPLSDIKTMEEYLSDSTAEPRFYTSLLSMFALTSLILAAVGIYGVISYSVVERTHELGVRMALGASRPRVVKLIVFRAMAVSGAGIVIGILGALLLGRLISNYLYGVTDKDLPTLVLISIVSILVTLTASLVPARRAAGLDPVSALRCE